MNKRIQLIFVLILVFILTNVALSQEQILIKNGKIVPVVGEVIPNGSLLIQNGKIAKIGTDIEIPPLATVIDAEGKCVYPGLVAAMTAVGVTGYPGSGNDVNELGVVTPQIDAFDAINPEDSTIEVTRIDGVTTVMTTSGSMNIINGKAVVLNLRGNIAEEMVIKRDMAQIFNMGAKGQSGFGPRRPGNYPTTLPGIMALVRDKLNQALFYAEKAKNAQKNEKERESGRASEPFKRDLAMEALLQVLKGKMPAVFITSNEVTIRNALQIIKEYKLKGIIYARVDILKFADQLAVEKIPVIWAGTTTIPERWQPYDLNYHTAAVLSKKGVLFCFDILGFGVNSHRVRSIPVPASISVAHGLSEEEAIKALTINPAKILGVDELVGSLEVGKLANVALWDDTPIQLSSRVRKVIIEGNVIPMTSVQTRLRDKFEKIVYERMNRE
ncbi:MAG TPA: amidohydrolase family protein [Candidatus Heimdallarchaeota archaeon]|nr:amidohydrolase family protein [Candidatus Heimdallarchaeota archaeon]